LECNLACNRQLETEPTRDKGLPTHQRQIRDKSGYNDQLVLAFIVPLKGRVPLKLTVKV
jgi:hypothetical protein